MKKKSTLSKIWSGNKKIFALLAHKHRVVISIRTSKRLCQTFWLLRCKIQTNQGTLVWVWQPFSPDWRSGRWAGTSSRGLFAAGRCCERQWPVPGTHPLRPRGSSSPGRRGCKQTEDIAAWLVRRGSKQNETLKWRHLLVFTWSLVNPLEKTENRGVTIRWVWTSTVHCVRCTDTHHLPEDFGFFGPGEGSVGDPAWHQPLVRVGSRPLHLRHHRLLFLLLEREEHVSSAKCSRSVNTTCWMTILKREKGQKKELNQKRPFSFRLFHCGHTW